MASFIIGAILLIAGVLLAVLVPMRSKNKNIEIKFMQKTSMGELKEILEGNHSAGLEGYRHYVELNGVAGSEKPNMAPFSGQKTAYYDANLYQVYEQAETRTDEKGTRQVVKKNQSLITNQKSSEPIVLKDPREDHKVYIDIRQSGIKLDTLKTLDKFEPANNMEKYNFFKKLNVKSMGTKTLGYRMLENTIPIGQPLYVLGEALLSDSKINILRPTDKKPFIVSTKSKADIVQGYKSGAKAALVLGIIIALAGIMVILFMR